MPRLLTVLLTLAILLVACTAEGDTVPIPEPADEPTLPEPPPPDERAGWPQSIVLALEPARDPAVLAQVAEPLRAALEQSIGIAVGVAVPDSEAALATGLGDGSLDLGVLGPVRALGAVDVHGARLVAQLTDGGRATYRSQWLTTDVATFCASEPVADQAGLLRCNGTEDAEAAAGQDALTAVAGRTVAFVTEDSASGYVLPAGQLAAAGVDPRAVEPQFLGGHDAVVRALAAGRAEVGVSLEDARVALVPEVAGLAERVVVFALTPELPGEAFVAAGGLPDSLVNAMGQALGAYAASEGGATVLRQLWGADGVATAELDRYGIVRDAVEALGLDPGAP
jgi:phosphonate transport system substrate-binding protein